MCLKIIASCLLAKIAPALEEALWPPPMRPIELLGRLEKGGALYRPELRDGARCTANGMPARIQIDTHSSEKTVSLFNQPANIKYIYKKNAFGRFSCMRSGF